jgi:hypothetical protein
MVFLLAFVHRVGFDFRVILMSISVVLLCEIRYLFPEKPCQNVGLVEILVAKLGMVYTFIRYHSRFFVQVGHETT